MKKTLFLLMLINILAVVSCQKPLEAILVTDVTMSKPSLSLIEGESETLTVTILPENASSSQVTWSVKDASPVGAVAVDDNGLVTAVKPGRAKVVALATDGSKKFAECVVTVEKLNIPVSKIEILSEKRLLIDQEYTFEPLISPLDATDRTITWSIKTTTPSGVITLGQDGKIVAMKPGKATVLARANDESGVEAECDIEVEDIYIDLVTTKSMFIGDVESFEACVYPDDYEDKTIVWSLKDLNPSGVVEMDEPCNITANASGTATLVATLKNKPKISSECIITVSPKLIKELDIEDNVSIYLADKYEIESSVSPDDATNKKLIWEVKSSEPSGVIEITQEGEIVGLIAGNAVVVAKTTDGSDLSAESEVTVKSVVVNLIENLSMSVGESIDLSASITPEKYPNREVEWSIKGGSSGACVALSDNGRVTANSVGTAIVVASIKSAPSIKAECAVTISEVSVEGIKVSPTSLKLKIGSGPVKLSATVTPSNAENKDIVWSVKDLSVDGCISVDAEGSVSVTASGSGIVVAKTVDGGYEAYCSVVAYNPITSITLPTTIELDPLDELVLEPIIEPLGADEQVVWSVENSSPEGCVTLTSDGHLTANTVGTAKITASNADGSIKASTDVTVVGVLAESFYLCEPTTLPDKVIAGDEFRLRLDILPESISYKKINLYTINSNPEDCLQYYRFNGFDNTAIYQLRFETPGTTTLVIEATDGSGVKIEKNITILPKEDHYSIEGNKVLIYSGLGLATYFNMLCKSYDGILMAHVDMKELSWMPNAELNNRTFDGNGYEIRNLQQPMFSEISQSVVKNIKLVGGNIVGDGYRGSIAIGIYQASLINCMNHSCSVTTTSPGNYGGGLAAKSSRSNFIACSNYAQVSSIYSAGGIVAYSDFDNLFIGCYNLGKIISSESYAGGLCAYMPGRVTFQSCFNLGAVYSHKGQFGAFIGSPGGTILGEALFWVDVPGDDAQYGISNYWDKNIDITKTDATSLNSADVINKLNTTLLKEGVEYRFKSGDSHPVIYKVD